MLKYTLHRILMLIPVLIGVIVFVFTVNYLSPVSPAHIICGENAAPEIIEQKEHELGLDRPYLSQLGSYLLNITKGDFGTSYTKSMPVWKLIRERIPVSAIIGLLGCIIAVAIGLILGIFGALKQNTIWDNLSTLLSTLSSAIPGFWLALLLMLLFSVKLGWTPITGIKTWRGYILPVLVSAFPSIGLVARMTRSSILESINSDFVRTARAKGLPECRVILKHVMQNSLIPVVTVIGSLLGHCVTTGVISETIFNIPGLGSLMNSSITGKDYITTQGCVLVCAFIISVFNMLTDLMYAVIDPRIKAQYSRSSKRKSVKRSMKAPKAGEPA